MNGAYTLTVCPPITGLDTAYRRLVMEGYLERPIINCPILNPPGGHPATHPVDLYGIDAWGYRLRLDTEYGPSGTPLASTGPATQAVSGNLLDPGHYDTIYIP